MTCKSPFIHDWVFEHAERHPDAPALATPRLRLGYGELAERVRTLAVHLAARGVVPGERVVAALPNTPATVVASLAVQALGGTVVEVNREWAPDVLGAIVARVRARHAFVWGRDAERWARVLAGNPLERVWIVTEARERGGEAPRDRVPPAVSPCVRLGEDGRLDVPETDAAGLRLPSLSPDAAALVLYTSGSTGRPRGVVQTFRNIAANTRSIVEFLALGPEDRAQLVLPLHYCYGRSVLQSHLLAGGSVFLEPRFAFPRVALEALGAEGCTGFAGVPLTFEIIRRHVEVSSVSLPRLRYLTQAGGAMAPETIEWVRAAFHPAKLFVMFGQTEATARLSYLPPERAAEKRGSIGVAIPGVELRIVDDDGRELDAGEAGHLVARGDNVTPGYLDEPEETAAILRGGWLWTGDLAMRDTEGFFFHRGRSREILKIGGHRVSPVEIEHVVAEHPDVAEAAVIGASDPLMGEVPVAFVVARPERSPTEDALKAFCRVRMPPYRVPVRFTAVASLPRNAAGKLLRAQLAAGAAAKR